MISPRRWRRLFDLGLSRRADIDRMLEAEQGATSRVGDGAHAASLIWPWPL